MFEMKFRFYCPSQNGWKMSIMFNIQAVAFKIEMKLIF